MKLFFQIILKITLILIFLVGCATIEETDPVAILDQGNVFCEEGQYDRAISYYNKAIEINSRYVWAYNNRGLAYYYKGQYDKAISDYNKALDINPSYFSAYNNKAWILATCPDSVYRDGVKAVELAKKAVELDQKAMSLDTLAAAYAEAGKFEDAIITQEKVIVLLQKEGKPKSLIGESAEHLKSYKAHKPWREK